MTTLSRLSAALIGIAVFSSATHAAATFGGPRTVEVLGYDDRTASVYYLEHDGGEGNETPVLYRLALRGARPRVPQRVPWEGNHGTAAQWEDRLRDTEPAFVALRARLTALTTLPTDGAEVALRCERPGHGRGQLRAPTIHPTTVQLAPVRGCDAAVHALLLVPWTTRALAIVRYVGVDIEGGYDRDVVVPVRYRPAPMPTRTSGGAIARVGLEAYLADDAGAIERIDLVVFVPGGRTRSITIAHPAGPCELDLEASAITCGVQRYRAVRHGRVLDALDDERVVASLPIPAAEVAPPTLVVVGEQRFGEHGQARLVCCDGDCRMTLYGRTILYEPLRGQVVCEPSGAVLRCDWRHQTNIEMRHRWSVDLSSGTYVSEPYRTEMSEH